MENNYDYIISGAGAAGLSLLMRMMNHPVLSKKKILVVDKEQKNLNDHTWCFWEREPGIFENIVYHHWPAISFFSKTFECKKSLNAYRYKMIRSADFYAHIYTEARQHKNISFLYADVIAFANHGDHASVITSSGIFKARYIFNSIVLQPLMPVEGKHLLLQHFKGWFIETGKPFFDPSFATFMDFRVSQQNGTTFVYVLPISSTKALVEFTLFSEKLLSPEMYDTGLKEYVHEFLKIGDYSISETEFGVIPMTNISFSKGEGRIHHIGTAGNWTKPSTGFTFRFIQKHTALIVEKLAAGKPITQELFRNKRFDFYDATFLNVLAGNKVEGEKIFTAMFEKNSIEEIFRFLDNESTIAEEISIMKNLPIGIFAKAGWQELVK